MTSRADCADIVRQLWPFLDDALPDAWRTRVTDHLVACTECRSHFDFERAFLAALRDTATDYGADDAELRARIVGALAAHGFQSV